MTGRVERRGAATVVKRLKELFTPTLPAVYIVISKYPEYPASGPEYPDSPDFPGPAPETPAPLETKQKRTPRNLI